MAASSRWLFLRHGQSEANRDGWLAGHHDTPLTEVGREQARSCAAQVLAQKPDLAWCSDLARAAETARLVVPATVRLQITPLLRERHLGEWEGAAREALVVSGAWEQLLEWESRPPGGESRRQVASRILSWLDAHDESGRTTLVVGHGTALGSVIGLLDGLAPQAVGRFALRNCHLQVREVRVGTWSSLLAGIGGGRL